MHNSHIHKVKIINKINNKTKYFSSLSEASRYIGNNNGYISNCFKKRKFEYKDENVKYEDIINIHKTSTDKEISEMEKMFGDIVEYK